MKLVYVPAVFCFCQQCSMLSRCHSHVKDTTNQNKTDKYFMSTQFRGALSPQLFLNELFFYIWLAVHTSNTFMKYWPTNYKFFFTFCLLKIFHLINSYYLVLRYPDNDCVGFHSSILVSSVRLFFLNILWTTFRLSLLRSSTMLDSKPYLKNRSASLIVLLG